MKMPLAYVTAAWSGDPVEATEQAVRYCRAVYEAGFSPICPTLYLPFGQPQFVVSSPFAPPSSSPENCPHCGQK